MNTTIESVDDYKIGDKTCHGGRCSGIVRITVMKEIYNDCKVAVTANFDRKMTKEEIEKIFDEAKEQTIRKYFH